MRSVLALEFSPGDEVIAVAIIAACLVVMCLKTLAAELERAIRLHNLSVEAQMLRNRQLQRLRALGVKTRD